MNWMEGSNAIKGFNGGFIMGSHAASTLSTAGIVPLSAYGMMSDYFGATFAAAYGAGFRVQPIGCVASTLAATESIGLARPCFSYSGSIAFVSIMKGSVGLALQAVLSSADLAFYWWGFIVSTPWSKYTTS